MKIKKNVVDKQKRAYDKHDTKIVDILCIFMLMAIFILTGVIIACLLIIFI